MKEDTIFKALGLPFTLVASVLVLTAVPFIKVAKKLGHNYWQW